jgi:hypothetical protein
MNGVDRRFTTCNETVSALVRESESTENENKNLKR